MYYCIFLYFVFFCIITTLVAALSLASAKVGKEFSKRVNRLRLGLTKHISSLRYIVETNSRYTRNNH